MTTLLSDEFWHFAERYIEIDTSLAAGNARIEPLIHELLEPLDPRWYVQRVEFRGRPNINICASFGPEAPGGLLLVTHSDTVPPGDPSRWTRGPAHRLTRADDQVVGLGVADVKLDYLCKAFALKRLDLTRLKKPLRLLATYGEEVGLNGAKTFLTGTIPKPEWALCGEPSELIPCHAHKGYAVIRVSIRPRVGDRLPAGPAYRLKVQGKAAHSSTPALGINAIHALVEQVLGHRGLQVAQINGGTSSNTVPAEAEAIVVAKTALANATVERLDAPAGDLRPALACLQQLWQLWTQESARLEPRTDSEFDPDHVVTNLGQISSEDGRITALFDARLLPEHAPATLITAFRERAKQLVGAEYELVIGIDRDNPGMRVSRDDKLITSLGMILRAQGMTEGPRSKPTSTEAGVFTRAGCSAAVFGPGVSTGNAHTANEWNRVSDLEQAILVYTKLIEALCC